MSFDDFSRLIYRRVVGFLEGKWYPIPEHIPYQHILRDGTWTLISPNYIAPRRRQKILDRWSIGIIKEDVSWRVEFLI